MPFFPMKRLLGQIESDKVKYLYADFPMKRLLGQIELNKVKYLYAVFSHEEAFGADRIE